MDKTRSFSSILIPSATVFISSACIMIIELVAGRLTARHLGSSLYTWTSIIGVVLAGITIGNWLGGRIADKYPARKALASLFGLASVACVVIVALNNVVGEWIWLWKFNWPARVFSHVSIVFLVPSVLLGTISPVVAKMALDRGLSTGRTIGDIYAWGAAGSIAGTFLAGFYLIAAMGTIAIVWTVAGTLLLMGILYYARLWVLYVWAIIFIALVMLGFSKTAWAAETGATMLLRAKPDANILYEDETQYCYVAVKQITKQPDNRAFMQDKLHHSGILIGNIENLQFPYAQIYAAITHRYARNKNNLLTMTIGGGGYVFPRYIEKMWPGSRVDVVEIDPGVTEAAMAAFGLDRNTSINTFSMDARNYVDQLIYQEDNGGEKVRYDFIYEDAINDYTVPFQLVTKEFNEKIVRILQNDGVYMVNMIDIFDSGLFIGAYINTLQQSFPYVYAITTTDVPSISRNTFVLAASKRSLDLTDLHKAYKQKHLSLWILSDEEVTGLKDKADNIIITDDYAPVENLLAPVVRRSAVDFLSSRYLHLANKLAKEEKYLESAKMYKAMAEVDPARRTSAYNDLAVLYTTRIGDNEKALESFYLALETEEQPEIHYSIGVLLERMEQPDIAKEHLIKAADGFRKKLHDTPDSLKLWARYADALAEVGNLKEASKAFAKAVKINPFSSSLRVKLAKTLEFQGRLNEAIAVMKEGVEVTTAVKKNEMAKDFQTYVDYLEQLKQQTSQ